MVRVFLTCWSVSLSNLTVPPSAATRRALTPVPSDSAVVFWSSGTVASWS